MFILVHSKPIATSSLHIKPLRKSTKQSHLDHLHHNQESDLDPLKTHTSLGQHTNTKIFYLDPLKNTQQISANTQTLFNRVHGLHLLQKIIRNQYKPKSYSTHFDQSQTLSNLSSFKNSICFSEFIQRYCLL